MFILTFSFVVILTILLIVIKIINTYTKKSNEIVNIENLNRLNKYYKNNEEIINKIIQENKEYSKILKSKVNINKNESLKSLSDFFIFVCLFKYFKF